MQLKKLEGPSCIYCGCTDSAALGEITSAFGQRQQRRQCRHCGKSFRVAVAAEPEAAAPPAPPEEPGVVAYRATQCPDCGSTETKITNTWRPYRRHVCKACGHAFKSKQGE